MQISPSMGSDWADWTAKCIIYFSAQSSINPLLAAALFEQESGYSMAARSPTGAIGTAQLQPETAEAIGVNPYDPNENIQGGILYLATQLNNFSYAGNWQASYAVAAYNAGPGAIHKYGGIPPYQETINHVIKVGGIYNQLEASL